MFGKQQWEKEWRRHTSSITEPFKSSVVIQQAVKQAPPKCTSVFASLLTPGSIAAGPARKMNGYTSSHANKKCHPFLFVHLGFQWQDGRNKRKETGTPLSYFDVMSLYHLVYEGYECMMMGKEGRTPSCYRSPSLHEYQREWWGLIYGNSKYTFISRDTGEMIELGWKADEIRLRYLHTAD